MDQATAVLTTGKSIFVSNAMVDENRRRVMRVQRDEFDDVLIEPFSGD
ncbi:hypothetical protein ABH945_004461 [Paraburkholderia sp. GAS333]